MYLPIGRQAKYPRNACCDRNENYSFKYQYKHSASRMLVLCTSYLVPCTKKVLKIINS